MPLPAASTLSRFHETSAKFQRYKILLRRRWWFLLLTSAIAICVQTLRITGKPVEFFAVGKVLVGANVVTDPQKQVVTNQQTGDIYGTQIEIIESNELRRRALERVRSMNPELKEIDVEIRVSQTKGSSILNVAGVGEDGKYTRLFLSALLDEYVAFRKEMIEKSLGSAMNKVIEEVLSREKQVKEKSATLNDFLQKNDMVVLEGGRNRAADYLLQLQDSLVKYQMELKTMDKLQMDDYLRAKSAAGVGGTPDAVLEAKRPVVTGDIPRSDDAFGGFASSEKDYLKALADYKLLQSQRLTMLKNFKEAHEAVREIDDKITNQQALIEIFRQASLEDWTHRINGLKLKISSFEEQILEQTAKAREANEKIVQHLILKGEYDRSNDDYKDWKKTLDRLDAGHVMNSDNIAIMERPLIAVQVDPEFVLPLIFALCMGLAVGSVILLLFDRLDDRMNSLSEFQALFPKEAIIGQIPEQSGHGDVSLLRPNDDRHLYAEAFRNLRSSILFKNWRGGKPPKLILITSAVPNEGKTTTVANFAVTLAFGGARVLLADADLRRGGLNELFKSSATPGFSEVLNANVHWRDAVQETGNKGLHLLPRGEAQNLTSELFLSPLAQNVLREMGEAYDYVIFDSAPVLVADDTASFAPMVDATMFVVRMSSTIARLTAKALDQLYDRQVNVVGVILNRSSTSLKEYTYYNYASYYSMIPEKEAKPVNAPTEA
ncbi:MAG: polysaccharide biosynthesis tyrosine autokinase [Verrucomicrobia bacterium]|nr:polysaccharide biosynthesis tyrosine autokinase [Verrucomicrobiota bacterium]